MKLSHKIAIGLAALVAAGVVVYVARNAKTKRMLEQIADEGYETAHDILFPNKKFNDKKLKYGPVLPG